MWMYYRTYFEKQKQRRAKLFTPMQQFLRKKRYVLEQKTAYLKAQQSLASLTIWSQVSIKNERGDSMRQSFPTR
jgi:hypothetical protein